MLRPAEYRPTVHLGARPLELLRGQLYDGRASVPCRWPVRRAVVTPEPPSSAPPDSIALVAITELDLELRRRKITGIVLAGISTSIGVESTARAANERGYELTVVIDAVTDTSESAHRNSLDVIFPRIAELATTDEVLVALEHPG